MLHNTVGLRYHYLGFHTLRYSGGLYSTMNLSSIGLNLFLLQYGRMVLAIWGAYSLLVEVT